jgi:hypothetical protein
MEWVELESLSIRGLLREKMTSHENLMTSHEKLMTSHENLMTNICIL